MLKKNNYRSIKKWNHYRRRRYIRQHSTSNISEIRIFRRASVVITKTHKKKQKKFKKKFKKKEGKTSSRVRSSQRLLSFRTILQNRYHNRGSNLSNDMYDWSVKLVECVFECVACERKRTECKKKNNCKITW